MAHFALVTALIVAVSAGVPGDGALTARIVEFEILDDFELEELLEDQQPTRHPANGPGQTLHPHWQPYSSEIRVSFTVFGKRVYREMHLNKALFGSHDRVEIYQNDTLVQVHRPPHVNYRTKVGHDAFARVTVFDEETIHGTFKVGHELFVVDPISEHWDEIDEATRATLPANVKMVAFKMQTMFNDQITCGVTGEFVEHLSWLKRKDPTVAHLGRALLARASGCSWAGYKAIVLGVAADVGYYNAVSGDVAGAVAAVMNTVNGVYEDQIGVHLEVGPTVTYSALGGPSWNENGPGMSINSKLDAFGAWRSSYNDAPVAGLWHLFTNSFPPPGTVGLAWVGVLCRSKTSIYGTGVSSISSSFWLTVAHELGHNFDACHDTDMGCDGDPYKGTGIMGYGNSDPWFSSSSTALMCSHVTSTLSSGSNCLYDWNPVCGNGVVETGEECDDTSSCCDSSCQLTAGSECSGGGQCCTSGCQLKLTTDACNAAGGLPGYCGVGGACIVGDCYYSNGGYCAIVAPKTCWITCSLSGSSTCYNKNQVSVPAGVWIAEEGSKCDTNSYCSSAGECEVSSTPTYAWATGSWGSCSVSCGGGTRTRSVTCEETIGGTTTTVGSSFCNAGTKPATSETCNSSPCTTYAWKLGGFGSCTVTCGGGTQTRSVQCEATTGSSTSIVADSFCPSPKPGTSQNCNEDACATYSWYTSAWGPCSKECGSGEQTRTVYCELDAGGSTSAVADSFCSGEGTKPAATNPTPCNTASCSWEVGTWGTCDAPCGPGTRTRTVQCEAPSGTTVPDADCTDPEPDSAESCNLGACATYAWISGSPGACSESCGTGTQAIVVECERNDGAIVADSFCPAGSKPPTSVPCNTDACVWVTGTWGTCSASCGGGTQSRSVDCESASGQPGNLCNAGSEPVSSRACNTEVCLTYAWEVTYSSCSVSCGFSGTRSATVVCKDSTGAIATPESLCTEVKPSTSGYACDPLPPSFPYCSWNTGTWGVCSQPCGDGTRTRSVTCSGATEADCSADIKPNNAEFCNSFPCSTFVWIEGPYDACSEPCGGGTQSHTVICESTISGETVPDSNCEITVAKPPLSQACNTAQCVWVTGGWDTCTASCGGGTQSRTVDCRASLGSSTVLADSKCNAGTKPGESTTCNTDTCTTYAWAGAGDWSPCEPACGDGTQTQSIVCEATTGSTVVVVANSFCTGTPPSDSRSCNLGFCTWVEGGFGVCSEPCDTGVMSQSVTCRNADTNVQVADTQCPAGSKPAETSSCNPEPCTTYSWDGTGVWGACSENCGPDGIQTRTYVCRSYDGSTYTTVSDDFCGVGTRPAIERSCNTEACIWASGSWTSCSETCGGGTQTREVTCESPTGLIGSACDSGTKPLDSRDCNLEACGDIYWRTEDWTACSEECGTGQRTRDVVCWSTTAGIVDDTECTETKPPSVESCNTVSCVWDEGAYGPCSEECDGGTQTRTVTCVSPTTLVTVPDVKCTSKPAETSECNLQACEVFVWTLIQDWTECSKPCDGGTRMRQYKCTSNLYGDQAESACTDAGVVKPATSEPCNTLACDGPHWSADAFPDVCPGCGTQVITREVKCLDVGGGDLPDADCDGLPKPQDTELCIGEFCITDCVCGDWSDYSECPGSDDCTAREEFTRTRTRTCMQSLGSADCCDNNLAVTACLEESACPALPECIVLPEQAVTQEEDKSTYQKLAQTIAPNDTTGVVFPVFSAAMLCVFCCLVGLCVTAFVKFRSRERHEKYDYDSMFVVDPDGTIHDDSGAEILAPLNGMLAPERYVAKYAFVSTLKDELSVSVGDTVMVTNKSEDGWFCGTNETTGETGYFPGTYVELSTDQSEKPMPPPKLKAQRAPPLAPKPGQAGGPPALAPKPGQGGGPPPLAPKPGQGGGPPPLAPKPQF